MAVAITAVVPTLKIVPGFCEYVMTGEGTLVDVMEKFTTPEQFEVVALTVEQLKTGSPVVSPIWKSPKLFKARACVLAELAAPVAEVNQADPAILLTMTAPVLIPASRSAGLL